MNKSVSFSLPATYHAVSSHYLINFFSVRYYPQLHHTHIACRKLTIIVWKADAEMGLLDLSLKNIFLVEEKNNRSGSKVTVVADTVEKVQALMHAILE